MIRQPLRRDQSKRRKSSIQSRYIVSLGEEQVVPPQIAAIAEVAGPAGSPRTTGTPKTIETTRTIAIARTTAITGTPKTTETTGTTKTTEITKTTGPTITTRTPKTATHPRTTPPDHLRIAIHQQLHTRKRCTDKTTTTPGHPYNMLPYAERSRPKLIQFDCCHDYLDNCFVCSAPTVLSSSR